MFVKWEDRRVLISGVLRAGYEDPLLLTAAEMTAEAAGTPGSHVLTPWLFTPSLGLTFPTENYPLEYFQNATGNAYNHTMLSWNSSMIGNFHPLIQQKKMETGKAAGTFPQNALEYRGLSFFNKTWAIVNVTGVNEGVSYGSGLNVTQEQVVWDSVLSRPIGISQSGATDVLKKSTGIQFNMTNSTMEACDLIHYSAWASETSFEETAYAAAFASITEQQYWSYYNNESRFSEYLRDSPLGSSLDTFFGDIDLKRDRCASPDLFKGMWDMSTTLACPTIYTLPRFLNTDQFIVNSTGERLVDRLHANPTQHSCWETKKS